MRPRRATGSQGPRVIHSATPAVQTGFQLEFDLGFIKLLIVAGERQALIPLFARRDISGEKGIRFG